MVTSPPNHFDRREAIRNTWAKNSGQCKTKVLFLLGQGQDGQGDVKGESQQFGDLIQEDFQVCGILFDVYSAVFTHPTVELQSQITSNL